ncbi:MAG: hypothetical protein KGD70_08025 [Candidatus Lokiarchaeota archaeon]|jgi:hypothetical protein|nr:hypothetical protein [Candidatus Lokiarchaeota archaeon]
MNIWILDSESGITLLYKPYMDLALDEDLISGLLAALNQFTIYELKTGIESIEMGGLRWSYLENKESNLLFVATSEKDISSNMLKARLNVIMQTFLEEYVSKDVEAWNKLWKGNTELFSPFKDVIDEYYSQWLTAENISTIAEYFDILGVFQQILNLLINVIEGHFTSEKKETIYNLIEIMFANYLNHKYVQSNPELSKISFNNVTGINIININPTNCDMLVVEKQIINLIKRITEMIKNEEGYYVTLHYFIEENIFEYLISNISLLKELNLFKFLLQLFLFK